MAWVWVWYGMDRVWYGMVWHGMGVIWYGCGMVWDWTPIDGGHACAVIIDDQRPLNTWPVAMSATSGITCFVVERRSSNWM